MKKIYILFRRYARTSIHKEFSQDYDVRASDIDLNEPWLELLDFEI